MPSNACGRKRKPKSIQLDLAHRRRLPRRWQLDRESIVRCHQQPASTTPSNTRRPTRRVSVATATGRRRTRRARRSPTKGLASSQRTPSGSSNRSIAACAATTRTCTAPASACRSSRPPAEAHGGSVERVERRPARQPLHAAAVHGLRAGRCCRECQTSRRPRMLRDRRPARESAKLMPRILIADDEPAIVMAVRDELAFEGFEVNTAGSGPEAVAMARDRLGPTSCSSISCCQARTDSRCAGLCDPSGRTSGSSCSRSAVRRPTASPASRPGADDYVTKPFSLRELVGRDQGRAAARERTCAERVARRSAPSRWIWRHARVVQGRRARSSSRPRSSRYWRCCVRRAGEAITRDEFLDEVWGKDVHVTHRTVDTHMSALRRKLEDDPDQPVHIIGVRGVGYRFEGTSAKP